MASHRKADLVVDAVTTAVHRSGGPVVVVNRPQRPSRRVQRPRPRARSSPARRIGQLRSVADCFDCPGRSRVANPGVRAVRPRPSGRFDTRTRPSSPSSIASEHSRTPCRCSGDRGERRLADEYARSYSPHRGAPRMRKRANECSPTLQSAQDGRMRRFSTSARGMLRGTDSPSTARRSRRRSALRSFPQAFSSAKSTLR